MARIWRWHPLGAAAVIGALAPFVVALAPSPSMAQSLEGATCVVGGGAQPCKCPMGGGDPPCQTPQVEPIMCTSTENNVCHQGDGPTAPVHCGDLRYAAEKTMLETINGTTDPQFTDVCSFGSNRLRVFNVILDRPIPQNAQQRQ
jgi:hypothetical protein